MKHSSAVATQGHRSLVFLLGHPLEHSLSPSMQNAAFRALRLPFYYLPLDIMKDQLSLAIDAMRGLPVMGANVTVPYKEAVIPFLYGLEPNAEWLGSVNTIYRKGKKFWGASTDGEGFLRSLGPWRKLFPGSFGLLTGAGGAAKAVAGALAQSGVKGFYIANRTARRADQLVKSLRARYPRLEAHVVSLVEAEKLLSRCNWVVQATSVGLKKGDAFPLSLKSARAKTLIIDLIYHRETTLLREAGRRRLPHLGGMGMLLHQGALSFEYWTKKKAPLKVMRKALLRRLASG